MTSLIAEGRWMGVGGQEAFSALSRLLGSQCSGEGRVLLGSSVPYTMPCRVGPLAGEDRRQHAHDWGAV